MECVALRFCLEYSLISLIFTHYACIDLKIRVSKCKVDDVSIFMPEKAFEIPVGSICFMTPF